MAKRGPKPHPGLLTPREQDVLALIRLGLTNAQIAQRLTISPETAKYHVSEILSKLNVSTREQAAAWQPDAPTRWPRLLAPLTLARAALLAGALAVVAALGILTWSVLASSDDTPDDIIDATATATIANGSSPTFGPAIAPASTGRLTAGVYRFSTSDSTVHPLAVPDDPADSANGGYSAGSLSANGQWLAYWPSPPLNFPSDDPTPRPLYLADLQADAPAVEIGEFVGLLQVSVSDHGDILVGVDVNSADDTVDNLTYQLVAPSGEITVLPWVVSTSGVYLSPDGSRVLILGGGNGDSAMTLHNLDGNRLFKSDFSYGNLEWSPDGTRIAIGSYTGKEVGLHVLDATTGTLAKLNDFQANMFSRLAWSPDASQIAFASGFDLYIASSTRPGPPERVAIGMDPAWSRDGRYLAYTRDGDLYLLDMGTREELSALDVPQPLVAAPEWLANNDILFRYTASGLRQITVANADGAAEEHLGYGSNAVWSPDGTMIAFIGRVESWGFTGSQEYWVMNADGSDPHKVGGAYSESDVINCHPPPLYWSADSSSVAYWHPADNKMYAAPADGSSDPVAIGGCPSINQTDAPTQNANPQLSPDGARILTLRPFYPGETH